MKKRGSVWAALCLILALCVTTAAAAGQEALDARMRLRGPAGLLLAADGTLYVADEKGNNVLRMSGDSVSAAGYTLPDTAYGTPLGAHLDGREGAALFNGPTGLAAWMDGLVVSDTGNHRLRLVKENEVRTLAGTGREGLTDGPAGRARFSMPMGLAVDDRDNLYVADSGNGVIRRVSKSGQVTTVVRGLDAPAGLCWYDGRLYVTDLGLHQVLSADVKTGRLTAVAGMPQQEGFADGPAERAAFSAPMGVAVTADAVYVADTGNAAVRRIRNGRVRTIAGQDNDGAAVWPAMPVGIQVRDGTVYVADSFAGLLFTVDDRCSFSDVKAADWFAEEVEAIWESGIMVGTGDGRFCPNDRLTRAEAATLLFNYQRSLNRNEVLVSDALFPDVGENDWFRETVGWAGAGHVMQGWDGEFHPLEAMDRQSFCTALYQYALSLGEAPAARRELTQFGDWELAAPWARPALCWAVDRGILVGTPEGNAEPEALLTRAEAAAMLTRLMGLTRAQ